MSSENIVAIVVSVLLIALFVFSCIKVKKAFEEFENEGMK